jgi:hypothetical protein
LYSRIHDRLLEGTLLVLALCHFVVCYGYLAILPICLWPLINRVVVSTLWPSPQGAFWSGAWYAVTWLAPLVLLAVVVIALYLPVIIVGG